MSEEQKKVQLERIPQVEKGSSKAIFSFEQEILQTFNDGDVIRITGGQRFILDGIEYVDLSRAGVFSKFRNAAGLSKAFLTWGIDKGYKIIDLKRNSKPGKAFPVTAFLEFYKENKLYQKYLPEFPMDASYFANSKYIIDDIKTYNKLVSGAGIYAFKSDLTEGVFCSNGEYVTLSAYLVRYRRAYKLKNTKAVHDHMTSLAGNMGGFTKIKEGVFKKDESTYYSLFTYAKESNINFRTVTRKIDALHEEGKIDETKKTDVGYEKEYLDEIFIDFLGGALIADKNGCIIVGQKKYYTLPALAEELDVGYDVLRDRKDKIKYITGRAGEKEKFHKYYSYDDALIIVGVLQSLPQADKHGCIQLEGIRAYTLTYFEEVTGKSRSTLKSEAKKQNISFKPLFRGKNGTVEADFYDRDDFLFLIKRFSRPASLQQEIVVHHLGYHHQRLEVNGLAFQSIENYTAWTGVTQEDFCNNMGEFLVMFNLGNTKIEGYFLHDILEVYGFEDIKIPRRGGGKFHTVGKKKIAAELTLARELNLNPQTIQKRVVRSKIQGFSPCVNANTVFYYFDEVEDACADMLQDVPETDQDGWYRKDGKQATNLKKYRTHFGRSLAGSSVASRVEKDGVQGFKARLPDRQVVTIYREDEVKSACHDLLEELLIADKENWIWNDKRTSQAGTLSNWSQNGYSRHYVTKLMKYGLTGFKGWLLNKKGAPSNKRDFYWKHDIEAAEKNMKEQDLKLKDKTYYTKDQVLEDLGKFATSIGVDILKFRSYSPASSLSIGEKSYSLNQYVRYFGVALGFIAKATDTSYSNKDLMIELLKIAELHDHLYMLDALKNDIISLIQEKDIRELLRIFGGTNGIDLLMKLHPKYKVLGVEYISGVISEYLGDYLLQKTLPDFSVIPKDLDLSNTDFELDLLHVVKEDFIQYFLRESKVSDKTESELVDGYLIWLKHRFDNIEHGHPELYIVLNKFSTDLSEIQALEKPSVFIDALSGARPFPDFFQKLNAYQVRKHKRFLIADQMGLGKSASAILTKESLGEKAKTALCVVPANVISTWETYLSSRKSDQHGKKGYFREGEEPRVLVVESPADIEDVTDYDYVLISHKKVGMERYEKKLGNQLFDFLLIDEVHKFKNITDGKGSQNLLKLSQSIEERDGYVCMLSGTPIPNTVKDIGILLKLLYPERFGDVADADLVNQIINGDILDLRSLLLPRMEMKKLQDHVDMPELYQQVTRGNLDETGQKIYEALLENDELTASNKIHAFRKLCLDPNLLEVSAEMQSAKLDMLQTSLTGAIENGKKRILVFANGYIEGVLRGDPRMIDGLQLPDGVDVMTIHGDTKDRDNIQEKFNGSGTGVQVLFVSGQTADVGIDLSGNDYQIFLNEPWTQDGKDQLIGRGYRPGLENDLISETLLLKNTIEEGIHYYIGLKQKAIQKLILGIPLQDFEKKLLLETEEKDISVGLEVNEQLAQFYMSRIDKLNKMFGYVSQGGVDSVEKLIASFGEEFTAYYQTLGARSYQANANRVNLAIMNQVVDVDATTKILDLGSGPKLLEKHIHQRHKEKVWSLDLNPHHFDDGDTRSVVGNFLDTPFEDNEFDVISSSLAFNETKLVPSKGNYERVEFFLELHRILQPGGVGIINSVYSLGFIDFDLCKEFLHTIGFDVIEEYSGNAEYENQYHSKVLTLKKRDVPTFSLEEVIERFSAQINGLKMRKEKISLKKQRNILQKFTLQGHELSTELNEHDLKMLLQEHDIKELVESLLAEHGSKEKIPKEVLLDKGLIRFRSGKTYSLLALLEDEGGIMFF